MSLNIFDLIEERIKTDPDRAAVIHHLGRAGRVELTYGRLGRAAADLADRLAEYDLGPGRFVGLLLRRSPLHLIALLAAARRGAAFFSLNPKIRSRQAAQAVRATRAPLLLVDGQALLRLGDLAPEDLPQTELVVVTDAPLAPIQQKTLTKLADRLPVKTIDLTRPAEPTDRPADPARPRLGDDPALALFTSGSTGRPKGVLISHQDLFNRVIQEAADYRIGPEDRLLSLLPFSFDVGCNQMFTALSSGATLVIVNSWLPGDLVAAVDRYGVTGISGVPSIWAGLLDLNPDRVEPLRRVRYITVSGGDMAPEQLDRLAQLVAPCGIYKTYGQTETFRSGLLFPDELADRPGSVGRPVNGTEVAIIDGKGRPLGPGHVGQIIHRGAGTMLGYLDDPAASRAKLKADPLRPKEAAHPGRAVYTGDLGWQDEQGYLYIKGRRDRMLKIRGNRVYPQEIVKAALAHRSVREAAVIDLKNDQGETEIVIEVRLAETGPEAIAELSRFLTRSLPAYMLPRKIVPVDSFPRTASGKIALARVKDKYRDRN